MKYTPKQCAVLETRLMGMTESKALAHLEKQGFKMHRNSYYRILKNIKSHTDQRMSEIARTWPELHVERIDKLRKLESEMWADRNAKKQIVKNTIKIMKGVDKNGNPFESHTETPELTMIEQTPVERTKIRQQIAEMQLYISAYEEATKDIMEFEIRNRIEEVNSISEPART